MSRIQSVSFAAFVFLFLLPVVAVAQVPRLIHYQATLIEGEFPVDGMAEIGVAFYEEETGGTPVAGWQETYTDVQITAGRMSLLLGSQTALPDALFESPSLYLEVVVDDETMPRLPVASTLFSIRAGQAESVIDGGVSAEALADASVTGRAMAEGAVTATALADESVTADAMADESVGTAKIADGSVSTAKIADDAVTSAKIGPRAVIGTSLADGVVSTEKLANGAVTSAKVASGQLVTNLNGLTDGIRLVAGENVSVSPNAEAGTITIDAAGSDWRGSSRRWKTDIHTLGDPLTIVEQLRGVRYKWAESGAADIGLIAEEVGEVLPEVVKYAANGVDADAVNYAHLVGLLIEGMKAQQAQIEALETRIHALEGTQPTP